MSIVDAEAEDVAEEIMDAVSVSSRRCNRKRAPLRLRVTREMWEKNEVWEALELARKVRLVKELVLADGTLGVCIAYGLDDAI